MSRPIAIPASAGFFRARGWIPGLLIVALSAGRAAAQVGYVATGDAAASGITVQGTGEVHALPNVAEIDLRTGASAEITADSLVKHRDARRRIDEAFAALKLDGLKLEEQGLALSVGDPDSMSNAMRGMPSTSAGRTEVQIRSVLRLRLAGIDRLTSDEVLDTIGKLLDVAQDAGAMLGPSPAEVNMAYRYGMTPSAASVRFIVRDLDALRELAYQQAVADARTRAARLARLNGVRLGDVVGVREVQVSGDDATITIRQPWGGVSTQPSGAKEPQLISETFGEVPLRVVLSVRFEIAPGKPVSGE
jgi:uncharacterized protein YggE